MWLTCNRGMVGGMLVAGMCAQWLILSLWVFVREILVQLKSRWLKRLAQEEISLFGKQQTLVQPESIINTACNADAR